MLSPQKNYIILCDGEVFSIDRGLLMGANCYTHLSENFVKDSYWIPEFCPSYSQIVEHAENVKRPEQEKVKKGDRALELYVDVYQASLFKGREVFHRWDQTMRRNPSKFTVLFALKARSERKLPRKSVKSGNGEHLSILG